MVVTSKCARVEGELSVGTLGNARVLTVGWVMEVVVVVVVGDREGELV